MKSTVHNIYIKDNKIKKLVPLKANPLANSEVRVFLWQHTFDRAKLINFAESYYPTTDFSQYNTLRDKRFIEKLSILLLLHQILGSEVTISYYATGRPYIKSYDDIKISISHTTNTYAISFSVQPHGIDIEHYGETAFKVKRMYVNDAESKWLKQNITSEIEIYTQLWSAKEAIYKLYDQPGLSFKHDIIVKSPSSPSQYTAYISSLQKKCYVELYPYSKFILTIAYDLTHEKKTELH